MQEKNDSQEENSLAYTFEELVKRASYSAELKTVHKRLKDLPIEPELAIQFDQILSELEKGNIFFNVDSLYFERPESPISEEDRQLPFIVRDVSIKMAERTIYIDGVAHLCVPTFSVGVFVMKPLSAEQMLSDNSYKRAIEQASFRLRDLTEKLVDSTTVFIDDAILKSIESSSSLESDELAVFLGRFMAKKVRIKNKPYSIFPRIF